MRDIDDYILDVARRELWHGWEPITVEPQVFDLLVYLAQNPDRIVSKDERLQAVWDGRIVSDSAINNRVNAARRAIGDSGEAQRLILRMPREGFRFIGAIRDLGAELTKAAVPRDYPRPLVIPCTFAVAAASALLSATRCVFVLWGGRPAIATGGRNACRPNANFSIARRSARADRRVSP